MARAKSSGFPYKIMLMVHHIPISHNVIKFHFLKQRYNKRIEQGIICLNNHNIKHASNNRQARNSTAKYSTVKKIYLQISAGRKCFFKLKIIENQYGILSRIIRGNICRR